MPATCRIFGVPNNLPNTMNDESSGAAPVTTKHYFIFASAAIASDENTAHSCK